MTDADFWVSQVRETVRFADGVAALGDAVLCEVGPDAVLSALTDAVPLQRAGRDQAVTLLAGVGRLWSRGVPVDWRAVIGPASIVDLPTYAFQHEHYWLASESPSADLTYAVEWERLADEPAASVVGRWLLVAPAGFEEHDLVRACAETLDADLLVLSVADDRESIAARLREVPPPDGVFSLLVLDTTLHLDHPGLAVGGTLALLLVQALGDVGLDAPLWFGTRGAVAVGAEPFDAVEHCGVWALGRVAALEHPERWGGLVDLPADFDDDARRELAVTLRGAEDQVAIRVGGRYGRRLARAAPSPGPAGAWRPRGTALITGGTGGLGAHTARWLARAGTEHLLLLSRSGPAADGADELLAELTALGARAEAVACDVTDHAALDRVIREAREGGAEFRTVVHAAGLGRRVPIAELDPAELAAVTAAKVIGAVLLDQLFDDDELDAFVLFSSIAGVWGSGHQAAYAAGNAFLDGIATLRRAAGVHAVSISWGPWAARGMGDDQHLADFLKRRGLRALSPETALRAMREAVEGSRAEVVVAGVDWAHFLPAFTSARPSPLLAGLAPAVPAAPVRPDRDAAADLRAAAGPERTQRLHTLVRDEVATALGHGTGAAIDLDTPFSELGMDSLAAIDLRNALNARTGLTLPVSAVFDQPSVQALAGHVDRLLDGDGGTDEETEIRLLLAGIPVARLRETGLLDQLRAVAYGTYGTPVTDAVDDMDLDELVRAALGDDAG